MSRSKYRDDYEVYEDIDLLTGVVGEATVVETVVSNVAVVVAAGGRAAGK